MAFNVHTAVVRLDAAAQPLAYIYRNQTSTVSCTKERPRDAGTIKVLQGGSINVHAQHKPCCACMNAHTYVQADMHTEMRSDDRIGP